MPQIKKCWVLFFVAWLAIACNSKEKELPPAKGELHIESSPDGDLEGPLKVVLKFSQPMVAADLIGKAPTSTIVSFTPPIEGKSTWKDETTLFFVPSKQLPGSTHFVAVVSKKAESLNGFRHSSDYEWEFSTEQLKVQTIFRGLSRKSAATDAPFYIRFTQDVLFSEIQKHCEYRTADNVNSVKVAIFSGDTNLKKEEASKHFLIQPVSALQMDTDWKLQCSKDIRGIVGNLGAEAQESDVFHTHGPLTWIALQPNGNMVVPSDEAELSLSFSNSLAKPYKMSISPPIVGFPKRCNSYEETSNGPSLHCRLNLNARTQYVITVESEQLDRFGQKLGEPKIIKFTTVDAKPGISMESGYYVAELKRPVLPIWTRNVNNLHAKVLVITPNTFHKIRPNIDWWDDKESKFKKIKTKAKKVQVGGEKNVWKSYDLNPAALAGTKTGPGMYYVEIGSADVEQWPFDSGGVQKTLVNFTDIGVVSKLSPSQGLVWATTLSTGQSLPGAKVSIRNAAGKVRWSGVTDAEGVVLLPGMETLLGNKTRQHREEDKLRIFVSHGKDWTILNPSSNGGLSPWNFNVDVDYNMSKESLRGFMHTDRGLYRPGEKVHLKGLARVTTLGSALTVPEKRKVKVSVRGPRGTTVHTAELTMSAFGGFWTDIDLRADARLGDYYVTARLKEGTFQQRFLVEEYRPATFEVSGKASKNRIVRRGDVTATILAKYFYGSPLREGDMDITVHSRPRTVRFDGFEGFGFYDDRKYLSHNSYETSYSQQLVTEDSAVLDSEGNGSLSFSVSPDDMKQDVDLLVRAAVTSPANEVINKTFTIPYFYSRRYYGIKTPGYFMEVKKPTKIEIIGVNPDGKVVDGPVKVTVTRRDWNCVWEDWGYRGSYQCDEKKVEILTTTVETSDGKPGTFEFTPETGGSYWVVAEGVTNDTHSAAGQEIYAWGDGGGSWQSNDSVSFDIIADKKEYKVGDTATLILKTDLAQAKGLVTIERDGVIEKRFVDITPTMKHIQIPITAKHAPNVYVSVALVQGRMGTGKRGKPRMRMGLVNLPVRPEGNTLTVSVETDKKEYQPGSNVTATVKVTDSQGDPVSAELALTAADEGVLSLIGYKTPNPIPAFYSPWGIAVSTASQFLYLKDIPAPNTARPATGGDSGGPGSIRSKFLSTPIWKPGLVTDTNGLAKVSFQAPDNLTAFRLMIIAADKGHRFGSAEQRFTVSKPLQLHRILPRFLTKGDVLRGGVVVHNETGKAGTAKVELLHHENLSLAGDSIQTVDIPKDGRVRVLFSLTGKTVGQAVLRFRVTMNNDSDGLEYKFPVYEVSGREKLHIAHGMAKENKEIVVDLPADAIVETAEIQVSVDLDGLSGIEDGLRDLIAYPYGCLEQTTSKVIPMLAVRKLAEGLQLKSLADGKLDSFVKAGILKIGKHQTYSGGYSLWPGGEPSAYYTAYAIWGLHLAREAGYIVDANRISDGLAYLRYDGKRPSKTGEYYDNNLNQAEQAFALYVRAILGHKDTQSATVLLAQSDDMPVFGKAFLVRALAADLGNGDVEVRRILKELTALAHQANKSETLIGKKDTNYFYMSDSIRTTAIVLDTLLSLQKNNKEIPGLVRLLMQARRSDTYFTTQSNMYSLLALNHYADSLSDKKLKITVTADGTSVMDGMIEGKKRMRISSFLAKGASTKIRIEPKGNAHYNIELRYYRKKDALKGHNHDLSLTREYLDEKGQPKNTFKVGDLVRVRLTIPLATSVSHLMMSVRTPAGFEAVNSKFKTTGPLTSLGGGNYWGGFKEIRDDRVDFSTKYVWTSPYDYIREYLIRATFEGRFALPPSSAELMYDPKRNSQTPLEYLTIDARTDGI